MPTIDADGCPIHVEVQGDSGRPALILSNSLGTSLNMWDPQVDAWSKTFRVVRYDRRGHGRSGAPKGAYSMERLGRDVLAIADHLGIQKFNWCGLSLGGMVGQWLGANAPDRVEKLILSNTACHYAEKNVWLDRMQTVRDKGIAAIADGTMERWFTKEFREREKDTVARVKEMFLQTSADGYLGCCEAIVAMDHRPLLEKIKAPTLVIAGKQDPATPLPLNEYIRDHIPGAQFEVLDAAHISNIERADEYRAAVLRFLG